MGPLLPSARLDDADDAPMGSAPWRGAPQAQTAASRKPPPPQPRPDKARPSPPGARKLLAGAGVASAWAGVVNVGMTRSVAFTRDALGGENGSPYRSVAEALVPELLLGLGTLLIGMLTFTAVGLGAFAFRRWATRDEPRVYYRCDGGDRSCCENQPHLTYLDNMRGYETDRREFFDSHLRKRPGCREVEPLVVPADDPSEPGWW